MDTAGCNDNDMTTNDGKYTNNVVYDNQHRTSTFVRFPKNHDAKIRTIEQRAADLLGYYSSVNAVECLQLVRYKPGQFFGVHHDLGEYNEEQKRVKLPPRIWYAKRRLVTLFCYLNSVGDDFTNVTRENTNNAETNLTGGATYFPSAHQLRVQPQAGRAVLFCNVLENGQPDVRTIHAGEPVIKRPMPLNDAQRITSAQRAMPPVVNQDEAKYGLNIWLLET